MAFVLETIIIITIIIVIIMTIIIHILIIIIIIHCQLCRSNQIRSTKIILT